MEKINQFDVFSATQSLEKGSKIFWSNGGSLKTTGYVTIIYLSGHIFALSINVNQKHVN